MAPHHGYALLTQGEDLGTRFGDEAIGLFAEIQRARLELLESKEEAENGNLGNARNLRQEAIARVTAAKRRTPSGTEESKPAHPLTVSSIESRWALRLFEKELSIAESGRNVLRIRPDGSAFQLGEESPVTLPNGPVIRRVLTVLAQRHLEALGEAMDTAEFMNRCWPGEHVPDDVASQRVRQVVARLRKAGMHRVLLHNDDGYLLDPQVSVELQDTSPPV